MLEMMYITRAATVSLSIWALSMNTEPHLSATLIYRGEFSSILLPPALGGSSGIPACGPRLAAEATAP